MGSVVTTGNPNSISAVQNQVIKDMLEENEEEVQEGPLPYSDENRKKEAIGLAGDIDLEGSDAQNFISRLMKATDGKNWDQFYDIADDIMPQFMSEGYGAEEYEQGKAAGEEIEKKKSKKKLKKETLDTELAEIDKQASIVALEAKLNKIDEVIEGKVSRLNMVSEDENLADLMDNKKLKAIQKEVKVLEKRKAKMEKMYEKMCGKKYQKEEVVEEATVNGVEEDEVEQEKGGKTGEGGKEL